MIVDSSALAEQVVRDVVSSAFDSAGQRCSALRVLCVQEEAADRVAAMLEGAMEELRLGDPMRLSHDVGPVIDARARDTIERHVAAMAAKGRRVRRLCRGGDAAAEAAMARGSYVVPTLIEIESLAELGREVFGPVLHLLRYRRDRLDGLLEQVEATGYGLTMGLHTRLDDRVAQVSARARVGNLYVNRNMVGAVVGVQPFGGEGLSGTGPKAGGPLYLYRLLASRPGDAPARPFGTLSVEDSESPPAAAALARDALREWRGASSGPGQPPAAQAFFGPSAHLLAGPTGERNVYRILPRSAVLCLAPDEADLLAQLGAVLDVGSLAVWDGRDAMAAGLHRRLPEAVRARVVLSPDWEREPVDAAVHHGGRDALLRLLRRLADREGAIVPVTALARGDHAIPLERLVVERAISVDTTAAGGNASLMTMDAGEGAGLAAGRKVTP